MADGGSSSSSGSGSGSGSGAAELKAGPVELRHQFNPDMHKNECMADAAISFDGNKYFLGGTLTGIVGMALIPRSQILYLRAAPFLVGGLAGIVADWWDNSSRCTEETRARLQAFLASQQAAAQKKGAELVQAPPSGRACGRRQPRTRRLAVGAWGHQRSDSRTCSI